MKELLPGEILLQMIEDIGWTQAELSRRTNRDRQTINDVIRGKNGLSRNLGLDIAKAFNISPEILFQKLGLFPADLEADENLDKINHLYSTLRDPENKKKAVQFFEFLKTSEEKAQYNARKGKKP